MGMPMAAYVPTTQPTDAHRSEYSRLAQIKKDIYKSIHDGVAFNTWIGMSDEAIINLAVDRSWKRFKEDLEQLS